MAVLTTSQLTFYDYKDSYSVEINPDCIVVNCDKDEISKNETIVNISYGVYCGRSRVSGTAVLDLEIKGEKIKATVQNCNTETDGSIKFIIPAGVDFKYIDYAQITFYELNDSDSDTFTFDKYVQFVKAVDGASGTGLVFKVYSENGTVFREDISALKLETFLLVGEDEVNAFSYQWQWRDNNEDNWTDIPNGNTHELIVNKNDAWAFKTIRCQIQYDENSYEDYISLTDQVTIYTSEIKYFHGSNLDVDDNSNVFKTDEEDLASYNVFRTEDDYIVAYMVLYENGKEVDGLITNKIAKATKVESGIIITDVQPQDGENFRNGDKVYFILPGNIVNYYDIILGEYDGSKWAQVTTNTQQYTYQNSQSTELNHVGKIMALSKSEISKVLPIHFSVYKDEILLSKVDGNVIDSNDPIISSSTPTNPINGQIWIDISKSPNVVKICKYKLDDNKNTVVEWVDFNNQVGTSIYTSKPSSYIVGDIWILNDGETCKYEDVDGSQYSYATGSMLKAKNSNSQYNDLDWVEIQTDFTKIRDNINNILQTITFTPENGLQIGQTDNKFYVQIDSTEMGFYDNSSGSAKKVVSISKQSANINNVTIENGAEFKCNADFNNQIIMHNPYESRKYVKTGFTWKIESDGSLSLVTLNITKDTIKGTWDDVFASEENGTYLQRYKIGDTVSLDLGDEGVIDMQIAAFDADALIDGSGSAKITWIAKQVLPTRYMMAPQLVTNSNGTYQSGTGSILGWTYSEMRHYLLNNIFYKIPELVRNEIKDVKKYSRSYSFDGSTSTAFTSNGVKLWIPSMRELYGTSSLYESDGPIYSELFTDEDSVIKYHPDTNQAATYWTRTAMSTDSYYCVDTVTNNNQYGYRSYSEQGIVLCFCT